MTPLIDEHVQGVGQDVREFAKMHADLACTEVREGSTRFAQGILLLCFSIAAAAIVLIAAGVSLFFLLSRVLSPAASAGIVAVLYLGLGWLAHWGGWRLVGGTSSVLMPRTRAMLWELLTCRDKQNSS